MDAEAEGQKDAKTTIAGVKEDNNKEGDGLGLNLKPIPGLPVLPQRTRNDEEILRLRAIVRSEAEAEDGNESEIRGIRVGDMSMKKHGAAANASPEAVMLGFLWMLYLSWLAKF